MKRLYLLRHAEAASAYSESDIARTLTDKGMQDAKALGKDMRAKGYIPTLTYCSPAIRTQQTLSAITETLNERLEGDLKIETPQALYGAGPGDMLALIQSTANDVDSLLIVAHNPTIHHIAATLAHEDSPSYNAITMRYAPGTLSVLDCDIENWSEIQPGENQMIDLLTN